MDQILNDPIISHFFQSIRQSDRKSTLKELILLGIHTVSAKIHQSSNSCCCCNGCKMHYKQHQNQIFVPYQTGIAPFQNHIGQNLVTQIQHIKTRINQIAENVNHSKPKNNNWENNKYTQKQNNQLTSQTNNDVNNLGKKQFRHHLDDSEVRKALVNPYAKQSPIKKQKKQQIEKHHKFQKQIDAQQLKTIKQRAQNNYYRDQTFSQEQQNSSSGFIKNKNSENTQNYQFKNVERSSNKPSKRQPLNTITQYNKSRYQQQSSNKKSNKNKSAIQTRSKIKSLIEKDKQKSKRNAFFKKQYEKKLKPSQYQYSDEDNKTQQQQEQSNQQLICQVHPNNNQQFQQSSYQQNQQQQHQSVKQQFKQSYKQTKKKLKQNKQRQRQIQRQRQRQQRQNYQRNNDNTDQFSESSSFSKFSMNSRRQHGKISNVKREQI